MLIYNSQKEFIGMDESDLSRLGFSNLAQLRAESADFADLFVKTPGYIHNFKHVHWIDFIVCADSAETPKVIIHANEKNYRCNINITTAYLTDNPTAKAYLVNLQNLRELSKTESSNISNDIQEKPIPIAAHEEVIPFNTVPHATTTVPIEPLIEDTYEPAQEDFIEDINDNSTIVHDQYDDAPLEIKMEEETPLEIEIEDDFKLDIEEELSHDILTAPEPEESLLTIEEEQEEDDEEYNKEYVFDPHLASDELGLPIDLIEEFIEDFIAQAKDFKHGLYDSLKENDINNVKILSHKLKGVAANLRIEDAFEVLTVINTSSDSDVIHKNLNYLYKIVAKLAGEEIAQPVISEIAPITTQIEDDSIDDDFILDFKEIDDDLEAPESEPELKLEIENEDSEDSEDEEDLYMDYELNIDDSEVPQSIEIAELADDDFISEESVDAIEIDEEELNVDLETIDEEELSKELSEIDDLPDLLEIEDLNTLEPDIEEEISDLDKLEELIEINYDKTQVADEIGIDSESFNELFKDYITESEELSSTISDAVNASDSQKWKYATLKLKGMSDNMRVHDFTSELELLLNTNDTDVALSAIKKINSIISKISSVEA